MRANDSISGLVLILFAATMFALTLRFPAFHGQNYGPALFPRILAIGIAAGGLLLVLSGRQAHRGGEPWITREAWTRDPALLINFATVVGGLVFYILAADTLGFMPTAAIVLAVMFVRLGTRAVAAVPIAIGTTIFMQWFFAGLMRVPLPRGIFDIAF